MSVINMSANIPSTTDSVRPEDASDVPSDTFELSPADFPVAQ